MAGVPAWPPLPNPHLPLQPPVGNPGIPVVPQGGGGVVYNPPVNVPKDDGISGGGTPGVSGPPNINPPSDLFPPAGKPRPGSPRPFLTPPGTGAPVVTDSSPGWMSNPNQGLTQTSDARLAMPIKARHDVLFDTLGDVADFVASLFRPVFDGFSKVIISDTPDRILGSREGQMAPLVAVRAQRKTAIHAMHRNSILEFERSANKTPKADGVDIIQSPTIMVGRPHLFNSDFDAKLVRKRRIKRGIAQTVPPEIADYMDQEPLAAPKVARNLGRFTASPERTSEMRVEGEATVARQETARQVSAGNKQPEYGKLVFLVAAVVVGVIVLRKAA